MAKQSNIFVDPKFKEFLDQIIPDGLILYQTRQVSINDHAKTKSKVHEQLDMAVSFAGCTIRDMFLPSFSHNAIQHNNGLRDKAKKEVDGMSQEQKESKFPEILNRTLDQDESTGHFQVKVKFSAPANMITHRSRSEMEAQLAELTALLAELDDE